MTNFAVFVLVPAFAVVSGWWGLEAMLRGDLVSGTVSVSFAVAFCFFALQWVVIRGSIHPHVDVDPRGTTIRPRKLYDALSYVWHAAAALGALLYVALAPFGLIDIPMYRSTLPWMMVFLAVAGVATLWRMMAHGGDCYLRLTPTGCEIWNGQWLAMRRAKWDDIAEVRDQPLRRKLPGREVIVLALPEGRSGTLLSDTITANSDALREWVRFYWQHPEYRAELTDGRALKRLDEERFGTE
ncbi:hypothetical protein L2K20_19225 [Mycobacterium sp. MBM]|nr:hypothetical protein [Mycobacterium sp. MBM]